jgi:pimeloyl-ACP methyl ester carboxylesterase
MLWTSEITNVWTRSRVLILTVAVLVVGQVSLAAPRPQPQAQQPPSRPPAKAPASQPNPAKPAQTQSNSQPKAALPATPPAKRPATAVPRGERLPEPQEIGGSQLQTRDGVMLSATFYPGTKEKESVPVLLLHNLKSSRKEFALLAPELQKKGCAVLVPDLRGHGASTTQYVAGRGGPREEKLDAAKFRTNDYTNIAVHDMAALRAFLVKKNNDGQLNMNKLVIVGSEMGAAIAMVWAAYDWAVPNYEHAGIKQGQDVKALVLISPRWSYTGIDTMSILNARGISPVRDRLSIMLLVGGEDSRQLRDVERIEAKLVLNRPQPEPLAERKVLLVPPFPTELQAEKLLNYSRFNLPLYICRFIEDRVINDLPDAIWMEHR